MYIISWAPSTCKTILQEWVVSLGLYNLIWKPISTPQGWVTEGTTYRVVHPTLVKYKLDHLHMISWAPPSTHIAVGYMRRENLEGRLFVRSEKNYFLVISFMQVKVKLLLLKIVNHLFNHPSEVLAWSRRPAIPSRSFLHSDFFWLLDHGDEACFHLVIAALQTFQFHHLLHIFPPFKFSFLIRETENFQSIPSISFQWQGSKQPLNSVILTKGVIDHS